MFIWRVREDTGAEYCSEDLISEIFVISKVSLTSTREETERGLEGEYADMFYLAGRSLSGPGDCLESGGVKCRC